MTREKAISLLSQVNHILVNSNSWLEDTHEPLNMAFSMAIKALEQEPCEDTISRQVAIDAIEHRLAEPAYQHTGEDWYVGMNCAENELYELPPVHPKTGHWIEIAQYSDGKHKIECSEYRSHIFSRGHANSFKVKNEYKFCPHCGAKMQEVEE